MFEGALSFPLFGVQVYAYGLMVMIGCWLGFAVILFLSRGRENERKAASLTALLSLPLGILLSRALYCLGDPSFAPLMNLKNALDVTTGGFSMYGALVGAVLAALTASRFSGVKPARTLDLLSPALAAFLIPARLGEGFTTLGVSRPLTTQWLSDSFLAMRDEYDAYLRTYLLEAFIALVILLVLLRILSGKPKNGRVFTLGCLLYGVTQTLMESLRYDGHLRHSFIGVQQVLSAALFSGVIILLAARLLRHQAGLKALPLLSLILLPLILGGIIGAEFMVDRSALGKLFSYALYLLILAFPLALGILLHQKEDRIEQKTD